MQSMRGAAARIAQNSRLSEVARPFVLLVVAALIGACANTSDFLLVIDCGSADQRSDQLDETGRDCLWESYAAADPSTTAKLKMTRNTIEGDPIPYGVIVTGKVIEVTQDNRADQYGGPNRGITTWRCSAMTKIARTAGSFTFAFSGCTGAEFPPPAL